MSALGERLRIRRRERKMTQEELASVIGYKKQTVSGYERGENEPDYQTLCRIADALSCTADYLLGREEAPTHVAASVMQQTGLSEKAVEVLMKNNKRSSDDSTPKSCRFNDVKAFLSSLICSKHLQDISSRYGLWKMYVNDRIDENAELDALDNKVDDYFSFERDEDGTVVVNSLVPFSTKDEKVLDIVIEHLKQGLDYIKGGMAIEGARYSVVRGFESFLTEQDETETNNGERME